MSSDIVIGIIAVIAMCLVLFAYRQGLKDKYHVDKQEPLPSIIQMPKQTPKPSAEQEKYATILQNIDSYNGTPKGQREVKI